MSERSVETALTPKPRRELSEILSQNPVMLKELRARMRGRRAFVLLTLYLVLLSLLVSLAYLIFLSSSSAVGTVGERQILGKAIFGIVVGMQLLSVCFIAPALTAGAISSEREHQTYDLLRTTLLPARSLVMGKFLSGLIFVLLLLFAALPLQSLAFLFGGVALEEVLIGTAMLVVTAITFCAVGIFFSSLMARTLASTVLAYAFAILLVFGLPMLFMVFFSLFNVAVGGLSGPPGPAAEAMLLLAGWLLVSINPIATAILTEAMLLDQQTAFLFRVPLSNGVSIRLLSPWIPYLLANLMFSLGLLWISILRVRRVER